MCPFCIHIWFPDIGRYQLNGGCVMITEMLYFLQKFRKRELTIPRDHMCLTVAITIHQMEMSATVTQFHKIIHHTFAFNGWHYHITHSV